MANGARMEGIEANVFFTFFGLDAIRKDHHAHIKVATVGNPGMHIPTLIGGLPGMSALATQMMAAPDGEARHPADPRVRRADLGLRRRALRLQGDASTCSSSTKDDFVEQVDGRASPSASSTSLPAGGEIIFT